ncbi:MAG: hypothetical protein ICV64_04240 [Thermoleophilia bacterium]|nr:hypothetical protein [Thermoleophilia bacterium]
MRVSAVFALALLFAAPAHAARLPVDDAPRLTEARATRILLREPKVADWVARYPPNPTTDAKYERERRSWEVKVWSGEAGQVAEGRVSDRLGVVTEAWTGPQVAWKMARGSDGAFGGSTLNSPVVWLLFSAAFLLGLADLRRPLSLRNLDLVVLLSFTVSLWFFNRGDVFTSVPLAYPPLAYLAARLGWIGLRGRRPAAVRPVWPVWVLAAATVFLAGFRVGLNVQDSTVIDVGYAGVVGAHRIVHGQAPYGHMPVRRDLRPCGPADADGEIDERIQTNGRCESAVERGDTYGPVSYLAYVPAYALFGWDGSWTNELAAAHAAAIAFDLLCLLALALVGLRFGGTRLAATLAFAWAAYPFTQYVSSSNTQDALVPLFLLLAFLVLAAPAGRGAFLALAAWTKFAPLVAVPLWATYPGHRVTARFGAGFALATLASFAILLLEPSAVQAARAFWERTLGWQLGRESPFAVWGWGQYEAAGIPDLQAVQRVLQVLLAAAALALAFVPRRKSPLQLAALTAALLVGVELVLGHWFYLYIAWFFPLAALALLAAPDRPVAPPEEHRGRARRELVAAG